MNDQALITTTVDEDERLRVALAIALPEPGMKIPPRLEDAAVMLGLTPATLANLLSDPAFLKQLRGLTRAQSTLALHGSGVGALIQIIDTGDNKEKLTAFKLLGTMTGDLRTQHQVDVKVTFDELRRRSLDTSGDPLMGLFDIKQDGGEIIDAITDDVIEDELTDE